MYRWSLLLAAVAAAVLVVACGGGGGDDNATKISDRVLRLGEGVGTEVEIFPGKVPDNLKDLLNPDKTSKDDPVELTPLPNAKLVGSARVTRVDGLHTFFLMYEVKQDEPAVSEAARGLFDETPWQIVGGQSSDGVTAYRFQSTRSSDLVGTVVVQPLASTETFEVVISRGGKEKKLTLHRHAFTPVLGAELDEREGGVVVSRLGAGEGSNAGLQEGDRVVKIGGKSIDNLASVSDALRQLGDGKDPVTSVMYVMQISPANPIVSPYVLPDPRPIPRSFGNVAPYLVLDRTIPIAVQWSVEAQGSTYQFVLLSEATLTDVADNYRNVLKRQNLAITSDAAQGTGTTIEFSTPDNSMQGSVEVDSFVQDDHYTQISITVQAEPGFSNATRPQTTPTPRATATATATAGAATATPTRTP
ncbi:MAG: hypothetical protein K1X87_03360 [Dehalococcoidia bacterium]|nr:hypothetical protein [Dehalococcoidia bacterium]